MQSISQYITRDKDGHFKIEDPIHQEDKGKKKKLNMHSPNNKASKYMNQEVKVKADKSTIKVEDFHTLLAAVTGTIENQKGINLEEHYQPN